MISRKEKWIYWLIGLGCGIIVTGLIMTYIGLVVQKQVQVEGIQETTPIYENEAYPKELTEDAKHDTSKDEEVSNSDFNQANEQEVKVTVAQNASATEICNTLEAAGVVGSATEFKTYIYDQGKSTKLRTGEMTFPPNSSFEQVLNILLGKKDKIKTSYCIIK